MLALGLLLNTVGLGVICWLMFTLAAAVLVAQGFMLAAALLFAFSVIVMLVGDNLVQPALIGNAIRLPFLLAFLGTAYAATVQGTIQVVDPTTKSITLDEGKI